MANHSLEALLRRNLLDTILDQKIAEGEARARPAACVAPCTLCWRSFRDASPALEERIATADLQTLSDLIARATVASSLADLERA